MIVAKVTRVANGKRRATVARRAAPARRKSVSNPAHMLTLAFPNPARRTSMVKAKKKKNSARRLSVTKRQAQRMMKAKKSNHRRRRVSNPQFFGSHVTPVRLTEYIGAGLVGVAANRALLAALPATFTSSNMFATLTSIGIALAQWWLGSMVSKDLGSAFAFGGLMNAASTALNAFIPSVGSVVSLSGRGTGDFVPATFTIPPQPAGIGAISGYPSAYPM